MLAVVEAVVKGMKNAVMEEFDEFDKIVLAMVVS